MSPLFGLPLPRGPSVAASDLWGSYSRDDYSPVNWDPTFLVLMDEPALCAALRSPDLGQGPPLPYSDELSELAAEEVLDLAHAAWRFGGFRSSPHRGLLATNLAECLPPILYPRLVLLAGYGIRGFRAPPLMGFIPPHLARFSHPGGDYIIPAPASGWPYWPVVGEPRARSPVSPLDLGDEPLWQPL